jgi:hypothetical protein
LISFRALAVFYGNFNNLGAGTDKFQKHLIEYGKGFIGQHQVLDLFGRNDLIEKSGVR